MAKQKNKQIKVNIVTGKAKKSKSKRSKEAQEVTAVGKALRYLGGLGGAAAGSYFGNETLGTMAGTGLGALISKWLGQGSYRVSKNSIVMSARSSGSIPMMHDSASGTIIRHREYLCPVVGSVGFSKQRFFPLQPGDSTTFPWLSGIAVKYQQYHIRGMVFHYVPTSGYAVSGNNPAIGSVMLQSSYRANDQFPSSKVEMLNEYWATEASPADAFCHPIECSPKENPFNVHYVRNVAVADQTALPLYDIGKTFLCTQGMPADGNVVGDLWVTYEIEFSKPQIASNVVSDVISMYNNYANPVVGSLFGPTLYTSTGSLGITTQDNTITFPTGVIGTFVVLMSLYLPGNFSAFSWGGPTVTGGSLVTVDTTGSWLRTTLTGATAALGRGFGAFVVSITDPAATCIVSLATPAWTGTPTNMALIVSQLS